MTFFNSKSLRFKLILLSSIGMLPVILGLFLYVIPLFENYFMEAKKNETQAVVDLVVGAIKNLEEEVTAGKIPEADAKERARNIVRNLKYNKTDYFFLYTFEGRVEAHGMNRSMENTERIESADANGKKYIKDFVQLATGPGSGFVSYIFEKEKGGKPFDKVAFVRGFPQWKWIIGSGVYVDTVQDTILKLKIKIMIGIGIAVLCSILFATLFSNRLNRQLAKISEGLRQEIVDFTQTAEILASASENLSQSATQQAAALQQTSASVEETSSMISKNADSAKQSQQISEMSQSHVNKGKAIVAEVSLSIKAISKSNEDIALQINQSNVEISEIIKIIYEISEKTKVINDIVFQTKLLSFNASVEAARAGENGKGFAVVADEVGKLAHMSGNSAKEITELLDKSVAKVKQTAEASKEKIQVLMNQGSIKIEAGLKNADDCNDTLEEIVGSVEQVTVRVAEITSATAEQARGVHEISKAMEQLDSASQHTSSSSQETAGAAAKLRVQVSKLSEIASDLSSTVQGAGKDKAA